MSGQVLIVNAKFFGKGKFSECIDELMYVNVHTGEQGYVKFNEPISKVDRCISLCLNFQSSKPHTYLPNDCATVDHSLLKYVLEKMTVGVSHIFCYGEVLCKILQNYTDKPLFDLLLFGCTAIEKLLFIERKYRCKMCCRLNCSHMVLQCLYNWASKNCCLLNFEDPVIRFKTYKGDGKNNELTLAQMGFISLDRTISVIKCYYCGVQISAESLKLSAIITLHKNFRPCCRMVNSNV